MTDASSVDEDYNGFDEPYMQHTKYPLHDCCEFEEVEALRALLYVKVQVQDTEEKSDDVSSSDDNDSSKAAHAAAMGHSPPTLLKPVEGEPAAGTSEADKAVDKDAVPNVEPEKNEAMDPGKEEDMKEAEDDNGADAGPLAGASTTSSADMQIEKSEASEISPSTEGHLNNGQDRLEPKYRLELNHNVPLNLRDDHENTALHVAIVSRKLEHVKMLLKAGASFRLRCDGSWPLHTAISVGAISLHRQFAYECTVALCENGADLGTKDDASHTPLFLSCHFNLPQIASYILSKEDGLATLNVRADRGGNRPLHAAAKFDTLDNASLSKNAMANATGLGAKATAAAPAPGSDALLTHVLLGTAGIEIDPINAMGRTPLHIACSRGNWPVARLLLQAGASTAVKDRRGISPGFLAYKRGMPIPNDLVATLGGPPDSGAPPVRDLIVDPNSSTVLLCHELCLLHRTCTPILRGDPDIPPENVRRLSVLVDPYQGILRGGEFSSLTWQKEARRAAISDVLKVHEYSYVEKISQLSSQIPDAPTEIANLDPDTTLSRWSFEAAMRAAGSVCEAVDRVMSGEYRNVFCAVRPPGHHAGPRGIVKCANDPEGSHGFCLLNNVAIGAAYARSMYRNEGISKVAIIDFDVHHGNGTEEIIRQLVPHTERMPFLIPHGRGELTANTYRPWLDETDIHNVFFASTHGYGNRGHEMPGWFYPASGKTHTSDALLHPGLVEPPSLADFMLSQTWARMGDDAKTNCCKIVNVGLELPDDDSDPQGRSMRQRLELRDTYRKKIFPQLREFDPDLIFISAGFDAHRRDTMNFGYVGMVEDDYEWVTEHLVKIANTCCNGRVVSVLEGGYKIQGGIISPFARSVASHVRALVDGGMSREQYDAVDGEWESNFERHLFEKRERKKEQEREQLRLAEEMQRRSLVEQWSGAGDAPEDPDAPSRKRRRNQVDYKQLFKQMQKEGFAS